MLEYFAYRKYKANKEQKIAEAEARAATTSSSSHTNASTDDEPTHDSIVIEKGKAPERAADAIAPQDELFLEESLAEAKPIEEPMTLRQRITGVASHLPMVHRVIPGHASAGASKPSGSLKGQTRPEDIEDVTTLADDPLADEETQRTQLQRLLEAFNMNLDSADDGNAGQSKTLSQRMNDSFKVSTFNEKTRQLMAEFMQILKDIQSGAPLAGRDLQNFFENHTRDLKTASDSVPSFIKALVLKLLPISAIPSIEELSKPGALMGLIKSVLQVLKTRFPAFVGGSVLMVMAVVVVMLGVWYAFKRGREERESLENPESAQVLEPAVSGLGQGRQVEISVDGVRYVTIVDEDGMRIPVPQDERGVYWDKTK